MSPRRPEPTDHFADDDLIPAPPSDEEPQTDPPNDEVTDIAETPEDAA